MTSNAPRRHCGRWIRDIGIVVATLMVALLASAKEPAKSTVVPFNTGYELDFSGFDSYVEVDHIPFDKFDAFTMEAWVKVWQGRIAYEGKQGDPESSVWFGLDKPGSTFGWESNGVDQKYTVARPFPDGWVHAVLVYNGKNLLVFLNGKKLYDEPAEKPGPLTDTRKLYLGAQERWDEEESGITQWNANGYMAALRITSKALYAESFTPPPKLTADKDTELLYDMSRQDDNTLFDMSSKKRNGAIHKVKWRKRDE